MCSNEGDFAMIPGSLDTKGQLSNEWADVRRRKAIAATAGNSGRPPILSHAAGPLSVWLARAQARAADRRAVAALDDHTLRDIGVDRANLYWEASKPFWRE
jgi:uncharacterized protein YjiS (DUF1127 family)